MSEDIRVVALIQAKQGQENAVQQACESCVDPTRQEAGCDMYVLHRDSQDPSLFVFVEHWKSESALSQHMQTHTLQAVHAGAQWQARATAASACPKAGLKPGKPLIGRLM
jgi:quinol monooxygenase YgiN